MYTETDAIFLGNEVKYAVNISCKGFDMDEDEFEVDLKRGQNSLHFGKENMVIDGQGGYYICFHTKDLGPGMVVATITAHVPDSDFPDGIRDEVTKFDLVRIKS